MQGSHYVQSAITMCRQLCAAARALCYYIRQRAAMQQGCQISGGNN